MKLAVVTPTNNAAQHLEGNIRSVLAQHEGVEDIIVDGGSRDGTVNLLRRYPHLIWASEADDGVYGAINKGLGRASGDVLTYLNAGDRYYDYTLKEVCRAFETDPELDFVYSHCTFMDETGRRLYTLRPLPYVRRWLVGTRVFWAQAVHDRVGYLDTTFHNARPTRSSSQDHGHRDLWMLKAILDEDQVSMKKDVA